MKAFSAAIPLVVLSFLMLSGCGNKDIQNKEAVKQGVLKYLSKRPDLSAMDVNVTNVSFRNDEANALVHFQAKNNPSQAASMEIAYVLERKGGEWVVKGRSGAGSSHGMGGDSGGMGNGSGQALPPGHPTVSPNGMPNLPNLPPGHPTTPSGSQPPSK